MLKPGLTILLGTVLLLVCQAAIAKPQRGTGPLELTEAEQSFLADKEQLKACIDPDWMPIERISTEGVHEGISSDYLVLFSEMLGIPIVLYRTASWPETIAAAKRRDCDIVPLINRTEARDAFLDFTDPYASYSYVFVTREQESFIDDVSVYEDQVFSVVGGYFIGQKLREAYPNLTFIEVDNTLSGQKRVKEGTVFAHIDTSVVQTYTMRVNALDNLKISGALPWKSGLSVATRNDEPLLNPIFEKVISRIPHAEKIRIQNKWIASTTEKVFDAELYIKSFAIVAVVLALLSIWGLSLKRSRERLQEAHDQLQDMVDEQRQFTLMLAHEFKNPLAAISRSAEFLLSFYDDLPDKVENRLSTIRDKVGVLLSLVDMHTRYETVKEECNSEHMEETRFQDVLRNAVAQLNGQVSAERLQLDLQVPEAVIYCDPNTLSIALHILIDNALKYSNPSKPVLVSLRQSDGAVTVLVRDSGIGISKADLKQIPKRFFRGENARSKSGNGLGLSIAQWVMEQHGGRLTIESEVGKGTTITCVIPQPGGTAV